MKNYSSAGTYDVPVTVEVPDTVTLTAQPVVKVELAKKSKSEAAQETQETESDEN